MTSSMELLALTDGLPSPIVGHFGSLNSALLKSSHLE